LKGFRAERNGTKPFQPLTHPPPAIVENSWEDLPILQIKFGSKIKPVYKSILRPWLFRKDAEDAHYLVFGWVKRLLSLPGGAWIARKLYRLDAPGLRKQVLGLEFPNPVGLAAGFDKNALLLPWWGSLGFGFVEIGTVTPLPQEGNPRPRLFRLPKDHAILNRMGFNNDGLDLISKRLQTSRSKGLVVGGNIGKNKNTPNEHAELDYLKCLEALHPWVDYFVVNVSSPNTPGLRELQEKEPLTALLNTLQLKNLSLGNSKPILLKIAPDLTDTQLDDIVEIVVSSGISGIVATNTTISRDNLSTPANVVESLGAGGISGAPLRSRSLEVIRYLRQKAGPAMPIIAVGGIMNASDALARMDAGANLVQVYSGYVYEGPGLVKRICKALLDRS